MAYDTIMVFPDQFKQHILPDQVHILNVAFLVPEMRREFGGVAGNISYNLRLLGETPYPMATIGDDFGPYSQHLEQLGISNRYLKHVAGEYTAQAFITTDIDDNQITAFHPGAMQHSHLNQVGSADGIRIGIVAPDGKLAMIQHSRDFAEHGIPHIFDPGQGMTLFNGDELRQFVEEARYIVVNDYEFQLLKEKAGLNGVAIAKQVEALIVTRGAEGSVIRTRDGEREIHAVRPDAVRDPTGCGDAFRSGLIYGLLNELDLITCCRIGSVMGAIKIAHQGPQNHQPTFDEIEERFFKAYGYRF
jgi:adenosine kinase